MAIYRMKGNRKIAYAIIFIIVAFNIFLSGCASNNGGSGNYIYSISKGNKFVLNRNISIADGDSHVLLQNGEILPYANIDKYAPYCRFVVDTTGEQTIRPDIMTVTKVSQMQPQLFPGNYYVEFDLRAANQPNIRSLACGAWDSAAGGAYLTYAQMQQALGSYFQIPAPKQ